jgi:hypothetical protein
VEIDRIRVDSRQNQAERQSRSLIATGLWENFLFLKVCPVNSIGGSTLLIYQFQLHIQGYLFALEKSSAGSDFSVSTSKSIAA